MSVDCVTVSFFFFQTHVIARILLCDSVITGTFSFVKNNHNSLRQNDFFFAKKKKRKQSRIISLWIFFSYQEQSPFASFQRGNENEDEYEFCPREV